MWHSSKPMPNFSPSLTKKEKKKKKKTFVRYLTHSHSTYMRVSQSTFMTKSLWLKYFHPSTTRDVTRHSKENWYQMIMNHPTKISIVSSSKWFVNILSYGTKRLVPHPLKQQLVTCQLPNLSTKIVIWCNGLRYLGQIHDQNKIKPNIKEILSKGPKLYWNMIKRKKEKKATVYSLTSK